MATCLSRNTFSLLLRTRRFYWDFTAETSPVAAFCVKKKLVDATFIPVHDHCVLCRNVSAQNLHMLDSVYHRALGFIANCGFLTHQPVLCATCQKCTPACASVLLLAAKGNVSNLALLSLSRLKERRARQPTQPTALTCWTWSILVVLSPYSVYNCFQLWFYHHFCCFNVHFISLDVFVLFSCVCCCHSRSPLKKKSLM